MSIASTATLAAIGDMGSGRIWVIVMGVLLAIVAISLLVASWTKWGQTKSLTKCIALAFLAHVWLLMYAYGTRIVTPGFGGGNQGGSRIENVAISGPILMMEEMKQPEESPNTEVSAEEKRDPEEPPLAPWEAPLNRSADFPTSPSETLATETPKLPDFKTVPTQPLPVLRSESQEPDLPAIESSEEIALLAALPSQVAALPSQVAALPSQLAALPSQVVPTQRILAAPSANLVRSLVPSATSPQRRVDQQPVPSNYQMRMSPLRHQFTMQNGGDVNTEAAVELALAWLARAQSPDGGWNAAEHGAGRETAVATNRAESENRQNAGLKANTAMTGLSLLAFLGAGHTHIEGQYKDNVANGVRYLLSQQLPSGDLSGRGQIGREPTVRFARMYSHGMAALSLAEAYGMTGDHALLPAIKSACQYSVNAMNPRTGGWRYEFPTEDPGDLSQFGWQAMLLNSASNHGSFIVTPQTRFLMQRFLDSVTTGRDGGLAVYRPQAGQMASPEQATPAMTAEAMATRLLQGFPLPPSAAEEGQRMLLRNLPGRSEENLYYWYYATIAMYQLRGESATDSPPIGITNNSMEEAWKKWNESLKLQLCSTQVPRGKSEGSWNPTCIWGGYGGRVYSTAVACMCLEVYYRYLPMYKQDQFANQWQPARR